MRLCCNTNRYNIAKYGVRRYLEMRLCCNMKHTENVRRYWEMRLCCNMVIYVKNEIVVELTE